MCLCKFPDKVTFLQWGHCEVGSLGASFEMSFTPFTLCCLRRCLSRVNFRLKVSKHSGQVMALLLSPSTTLPARLALTVSPLDVGWALSPSPLCHSQLTPPGKLLPIQTFLEGRPSVIPVLRILLSVFSINTRSE